MQNCILEKEILQDEKELLYLISTGDEEAFRILFNRYYNRMYANILYHCKLPELTDELTQDLFVNVWRNRLKLPEIERLDAFLYKSAKHLVLGALRKKILPRLDDDVFDLYFIDDGLSGIDFLELKELKSILNKAIDQLPSQMQRAFILHRFHGLTHEEIAKEMNISRFSSQTYVARALVQLRAILSKYKGEISLLALFICKV